jgi:hypothetical protein
LNELTNNFIAISNSNIPGGVIVRDPKLSKISLKNLGFLDFNDRSFSKLRLFDKEQAKNCYGNNKDCHDRAYALKFVREMAAAAAETEKNRACFIFLFMLRLNVKDLSFLSNLMIH